MAIVDISEVEQLRPGELAAIGDHVRDRSGEILAAAGMADPAGYGAGATDSAVREHAGYQRGEFTDLLRQDLRLAAALRAGGESLDNARSRVLGALHDVRNDGFRVIGSDWTVVGPPWPLGSARTAHRAEHQDRIRHERDRLHSTVADVAQRIRREADTEKLVARFLPAQSGLFGHPMVIETGDGDDVVVVKRDRLLGALITVNGTQVGASPLNRLLTKRITIRTQGGNDKIFVEDDVPYHLTIQAGDGDDSVHGSATAEYIDAGAGNDIVWAGGGDDVVYGGAGDDRLFGTGGRDYLDGGSGNDIVRGGVGNDILSGGFGDDDIKGNSGDDVLYLGAGVDSVHEFVDDRPPPEVPARAESGSWNTIVGQQGHDTLYAQQGPDTVDAGNQVTVVHVEPRDLPANLRIEGTAEFQDRMGADLHTLASSPVGQEMLASIGDTVHQVRIRSREDNWFNAIGVGTYDLDATLLDQKTGAPGAGANATVYMNPVVTNLGFENSDYSAPWSQVPPIVILHHEFTHTRDMAHGTLDDRLYRGPNPVDNGKVEQSEIIAMEEENKLRREMRLEQRPNYWPG